MTDITELARREGSDQPLVLVTGSTRGIGLGIARHLVATGNRVIVHGRDRGRVDAAAGLVSEPGEAARTPAGPAVRPAVGGVVVGGVVVGGVVADLTQPEQVDALAIEVLQRWGVPDGLVLCAGGSTIPPGPVEEIDPLAWDQALRDNLTSAFLTMRAFLPAMKERGSGVLVAISSSVTRRAHVRGPVAYTAAKAGLEALIRSVAVQAGPAGVRANCVVPETIMTERNEQAIPEAIRADLIAAHPIRRLGTVEDVAAAVGYLLSPAAGWVTGESIGVTGGT